MTADLRLRPLRISDEQAFVAGHEGDVESTAVLVTCDVDNVGSATVIERCGGVFESVVHDTRDGVPKRRYWIE